MSAWGNRIGVWMYGRSGGRLVSPGRDVKVLMLTVPGRRTGVPRSACVRFLTHEGQLVVWGTASGSPTDPDWFRNLRAAGTADVQVGRDRMRVTAREAVGRERDALWHDVILAAVPGVDRYARKAGRTIPIALLTPLAG
jgi:deazaflavin-dependent oxidoreductase (nitroreductase family)